MSDFSDILVRVGADVEPLTKGFQTAGQKVKGFKKGAVGAAKQIAAIGAAAAAAGAAVVAMSNAAAESAREIKNLSRVAGVGTTTFQKMAFASKTVGVEQDKLSDILKDTSDKVGDFLATGAGPMADFFENIAPQVGITADEFRNLSGPQALQKYVNALEKANVSQNEMTFYMEAIASDASMLTPLLKDGGAAMATLGDEAEKAGAVLSEMDISKLDQMKVAFDKVAQVSSTGAQALAAEFAPVLGALADEFTRLRIESNNFGNASDKVFSFAVTAVGVFADSMRGIQVIVKGLEVAFHGFSVVVNTVLGNAVGGIEIFTNAAISSVNAIIEGFNKIPGVADMALIPFTSLGNSILEGAETAKTNLSTAVGELHDIMMKPLPSDKVDAFVASAVESYEKAAESAAHTIGENSPLANAVEREVQTMADHYKNFYAENGKNMAKGQLAMLDAQKAFGAKSVAAYSSMFGNISSLMDTENKKQFEIGKKAAAAQTIIDTIASAQSAFKSLAGIPVVGPALGIAAAGAATVAGMARLQQINSTSIDSNSVPSGGAQVSTGGGGAGAAGVAPRGGQSVTLEGFDPQQLYQGGQVRGLIDAINENSEDGKAVVVA